MCYNSNEPRERLGSIEKEILLMMKLKICLSALLLAAATSGCMINDTRQSYTGPNGLPVVVNTHRAWLDMFDGMWQNSLPHITIINATGYGYGDGYGGYYPPVTQLPPPPPLYEQPFDPRTQRPCLPPVPPGPPQQRYEPSLR